MPELGLDPKIELEQQIKETNRLKDDIEHMMKEHNTERNRKIAQEGSLLLYESYFFQYNSLLFNCKKQYLKLVNL